MFKEAIKLTRQLAVKERAQAKLLEELERALLIKSIWPNAFDHGPCIFSGLLAWDNRFNVTRAFRCAWFKDNSGYKYYLSRAELKAFKPDAEIHKTFKRWG